MDVDFVIPLSTDDLLNGEVGCYVVDEVFSINSLPKKMADSAMDLHSDGPCSVIANFDTYFSLIRHFNNIDSIPRDEAWQTLLRALKQHTNNISPMVEPRADVDNQTRKQHLTALKMICYLVVQLSNLYEAEATKPTTHITTAKGRGRSHAASKRKTPSSAFDWDIERDAVIELIGHMVQLDINRLWNPPLVEEEFVNLITGFCYKLLENPTVTKTKTTKDLVFNLLATAIKKYHTGLGTTLKIIQMIQHFEHLVPHLSQAVELMATEFGVKSLVAEIIRYLKVSREGEEVGGEEIGVEEMGGEEMGGEEMGGEERGGDGRGGDGRGGGGRGGGGRGGDWSGGDGEGRRWEGRRGEGREEMGGEERGGDGRGGEEMEGEEMGGGRRWEGRRWEGRRREEMGGEEKGGDGRGGESYSMRNGVLGAMGEIVQRVLSTGELDDNAKNLRDQFLDKLELPLDHLKEKLAAETTKLKEMAPNLTQQSTDQVPVVACSKDTWDAMFPELQATVEEFLEQEETEHDDNETHQSNQEQRSDDAFALALKEIKELLNQGHHRKAVIALKNAQKLWPDETLLNPPAKDQENLFEEKEGETDTLSKEDLITGFLCILKGIFIGCALMRGSTVSTSLISDNLQLCKPCIPGSEDQPMQDDEELDPEALLEVANQSTENAEQDNNDMVNDIIKQQLVVQYLKDYVNFQTKMETAVPVICQLLGSKTTSDVSESIEFFVTSYEFGLRNAIIGVRRMLVLIWSRDNAVKESVVEAYKGLYLDPPAPNQRAKTGIIVKNLITLTYGASIGDLTSLEELMGELMKAKLIPGSLIKLLWEKFTMKVAQTTPEESRAALILLRMLASAETDIIRSNVDVLVNTGLGTRAEEDFLLARDTCVALLKIIKSKKPGNAEEEPFRFSYSHEIFERLTHLIVTGISKVDDIHFAPMAEQAINVIYTLSEHPEMVCENIIRKLVTCLIVRKDTQTPEPNDSQDAQTQADDVMSQDNIPKLMSCHSSILARFLVLCGHVALRQLIHLDVSIFKEIKRRQAVQESENEEKRRDKEMGRKNRNDVNATANTTKVYILANLEMIMMGIKVMLMIVVMLMVVVMLMIVVVMLMIVVILMMIEVMIVVVMVMMVEVMLMIVVVMVEVMMVVVMVMMVVVMLMIVVVMVMMVVVMMMVVLMLMMIAMMMDTTTNETAEEDMGLTGATADDVESEYIRKICEQEIVTGQNLLALLRPLLVCICSNPSRFSDPGLQAAVTLALAKFMLVSSEFCESHLQLLFTVLEKSPHATIRANTIIALGDLTFRFPNLLEPWTSHLYARLRDESAQVRKNTMMVLTHLILNDMVKVKGNISEMATCLEDKDQRIADLAKLFFLELAKKGNAVYNILPDIISRLSDPDCGIEEEPFRNILKYLLSFIQKDRQSESLVEKLCHRFRATRCDRQWRDLAFCLSLLPLNERAIRKLQENFGCFHDKLSDEDVYQSFMNIIGKSKKFAKPELKWWIGGGGGGGSDGGGSSDGGGGRGGGRDGGGSGGRFSSDGGGGGSSSGGSEVVEEEVVMEEVVEEAVVMEEVAEEVVEEEEAVVMEEVVEEVLEKDSVVMEMVVEEMVVEEAVVMEEKVVVMEEVVEEEVVMEEALVEELEQRIDDCHTKGMDDEAGYERASKASGAAPKTKKSVSATPSGKSARSRKGVTPARRRRNKTTNGDSDSEDEQVTKPTRTPRNPAPPRSAKPKSSRKRKPMPSFESDDDDDSIDLFDLDEEDEEEEDEAAISDDTENVDPNQENVKKKKPSKHTTKSVQGGSIAKSRSIRA
ncbi:hypothetical protein QZH41_009881 [Actinostola sp. cb2023]|nr:hypothetical protein QZH41_009881 [Actinostola sp. cb2023]